MANYRGTASGALEEIIANGAIGADAPEIEVIGKLASKDLTDAAIRLTHEQARFMVDFYYEVQDVRKSSQNRQRAAIESGEPNELMKWTGKAQLNIEEVIKAAMDKYTDQYALSRWSKSICGIGPVISAGLMAHLGNEAPPETVGHWWSFAGIQAESEWHGRSDIETIIRVAYSVDNTDATAIVTMANELKKYPEKIYEAAGVESLSREDTIERLSTMIATDIVQEASVDRPYETGAMVKVACERAGVPLWEAYAYLYSNAKVNRAKMIKTLTKRPWNARLKVLVAYKLGESFVKVQNNPKDIYGKVYADRKMLERERNDRKEYANQAEKILATKNFSRDTVARQAYLDGRLPDAHIHARARRKAVRLFLSHFHEVAYFLHYKRMPPKPFAVEYLGHAHRIFAPNAHLIPGLEAAQEAARRTL